jgi:hypothetical protein
MTYLTITAITSLTLLSCSLLDVAGLCGGIETIQNCRCASDGLNSGVGISETHLHIRMPQQSGYVS